MSERSERLPCRTLILQYLERAPHPVSPWKIASDLSINPSSVRARLTEMLQERLIQRPYRGHYQLSEVTHGVMGVLPRVHNLVLSLDPYRLEEKIPDYDDYLFGSHLRILYGVQRQRCTWFLSHKGGLDLDGLRLALEVLRMRFALDTGDMVSTSLLEVSTVELNEDYHDLRYDRKGCLTLTSFLEGLERIYQKRDVLRSEVKVQETSLEAIYTLLKGGVTPYNVVQVQMMQQTKLEELTREVSKASWLLTRIAGYMEALIKGGDRR